MRPVRLTGTALTVTMVVTGALAWAAAADHSRAPDSWIEVRSPHFSLRSTAGEAMTRELAADLENLHGVLTALIGGAPEPTRPSFVHILGSRAMFQRLSGPHQTGEAPVSGFFRDAPDATYLVIDASRPDTARATLYHEHVHQLAATFLPGLPLWFEEGLAEVYQTFQVVDGQAEIGRPATEHLARLAAGRLLPLAEVLAVGHDSELYRSSRDKPLLYAQCWALVHWLMLGNEEQAASAGTFFDRIRRGGQPRSALTAELGADLPRLEAELTEYVRRRSYRFARIPIAGRADATAYSVRGLSRAESEAVIGDLLLSEDPPRDEAEELLAAAAAADPPPALALSGLAVLAEHRSQWDRALELHRRAVSADGGELVLLRAASLELHHGDGPAAAAGLARRALALRLDSARALETLARALLAADAAGAEALEAAGRAVQLLPRDVGALHTLVEVQIRLDRLDEAQALVARSPALDEDRRSRLVSRLANARGQRVRRLLIDGNLDEIGPELAAIERLAPRTADPAAIEALLADLIASHRTETLALRLRAAEQALANDEPAAARPLAAGVVAEAAAGSPLARAAQALLDHLDGVPPAGTAPESVVPVVSEAELGRLNELLGGGRFAEAEAVLEDLQGRVGSVEGWWIEPKLAEVRRVIHHNRFVDVYNRAVDLADEGRTAAAIAALETLLAADPANPEAADARALLATLRAPPR